MGLLDKIFNSTPKRGQKLTKIGLAVAGVGASLEFAPATLESLIVNEDYAFWLLMAKNICYALGALITLFGLTRTEDIDKNQTKK